MLCKLPQREERASYISEFSVVETELYEIVLSGVNTVKVMYLHQNIYALFFYAWER